MWPLRMIGAALAFSALLTVWGHGYGSGRKAQLAEAARALEVVRAENAEIRRQIVAAEAARLQRERERDVLQDQLELESSKDADGDRRAFGADSMRRIGQIGSN